MGFDSSHSPTGYRGDDEEFIKASKEHFEKESARCVCGNIATVTMTEGIRFIVVCKSCKYLIDQGVHDEPTDSIRKFLLIKEE